MVRRPVLLYPFHSLSADSYAILNRSSVCTLISLGTHDPLGILGPLSVVVRGAMGRLRRVGLLGTLGQRHFSGKQECQECQQGQGCQECQQCQYVWVERANTISLPLSYCAHSELSWRVCVSVVQCPARQPPRRLLWPGVVPSADTWSATPPLAGLRRPAVACATALRRVRWR